MVCGSAQTGGQCASGLCANCGSEGKACCEGQTVGTSCGAAEKICNLDPLVKTLRSEGAAGRVVGGA